MYCGNNPVSNQDPNGHFFFGALIGGIIGGASGALSAAMKGKSVKAGFLTGAATGAAIGLVCDVVATGACRRSSLRCDSGCWKHSESICELCKREKI